MDLLAAAANADDKAEKDSIFKINVSFTFRSCLSKINNTLIENSEGLDIIMPMYNMLEYSHNYSMTLWNYYRDKVDDVNVNDNAYDDKAFEYKTKIVEET